MLLPSTVLKKIIGDKYSPMFFLIPFVGVYVFPVNYKIGGVWPMITVIFVAWFVNLFFFGENKTTRKSHSRVKLERIQWALDSNWFNFGSEISDRFTLCFLRSVSIFVWITCIRVIKGLIGKRPQNLKREMEIEIVLRSWLKPADSKGNDFIRHDFERHKSHEEIVSKE